MITHSKNGPALAAILSAGIGCLILGIATVLAEASSTAKEAMNWWDPAGPLTGKTGIAVISWIVAWGILYRVWRNRELGFLKTWAISLVLIALGWLGTFPPIFQAFARHE